MRCGHRAAAVGGSNLAYVADFATEPQYNRALRSVHKTSPGEQGVGSTWKEVVRMAGTHTRTVTAFEPNRIVAYRNDGRPFAVENTFEFAPVPGGTRLIASVCVELRGRYAVLTPLFSVLLPLLVRRVISSIRHVLEARPTPDAAGGEGVGTTR